jgi:DNA-binding PadR family transcriptional regulator
MGTEFSDHSMTNLTAAEVLALSALVEGRPMTSSELSRGVSDMGMNLDTGAAADVLRSLAATGMAERTPAASLGKYRITAQGRAWLTSHSGS